MPVSMRARGFASYLPHALRLLARGVGMCQNPHGGIVMRVYVGAALAGAILIAAGLPAFAHHSGAAEFDVNKGVELTGVITKIEWTNPHAHFYMDVTDASGKAANWNMELA